MNNFSKVYSAELEGIEAKLIEVETDINVGLHAFNIVGLADKALNEAKERVNAALKNSNIKPPNRENRRITVNLAPADIKKAGSQYDLAIALGYLLATRQIKSFDAKDKIFIGELSLEGNLRPINGVLAIARLAKKLNFQHLFVPKENAREAAIVRGISVIPVSNLNELINHLEGKEEVISQKETQLDFNWPSEGLDISEIKGQENAKRALIIAAAGGHNILMRGSPGGGKTMLAQSLTSILPPLSLEESLEVIQIYSSINFLAGQSFISRRPFRAPHHTASAVSIVGGGVNPRPGEVSLAHRGVLFLDEIPEFRRDILESLRQPLESGEVCISRARGVLNFPARFSLVAAMNPCPCGYYGDAEKVCQCSAAEIFRYQKKISGPLMDRIDIQINVPRVKTEDLIQKKEENITGKIREKIMKTRERQRKRFAGLEKSIYLNSEMSSRLVDEVVQLDSDSQKFLKNILDKTFLSARGYYRLLKTSRTIADLEESASVLISHLTEAFQYRIREG